MTVGGERTFQVMVWRSERGLVLYVPAIAASTTVPSMTEADAAARSLIADLTGRLDASTVRCEIQSRRARGLGGPAPLA